MPTKSRRAAQTCTRHILAGNGTETLQRAAIGPTRRARRGGAAADILVSQLMTRNVLCVRDDMSVESVRELMLEKGIGGAPVVDERGMPRGLVSKTDLVRALGELDGDVNAAETLPYGFHLEAIPRALVREVMTPIVFALPMSATVADAAALMASRSIHRVIVVDSAGAVIGIVTTLDLVRWLAIQSGIELPS
jgi:CBS domain-containing protein